MYSNYGNFLHGALRSVKPLLFFLKRNGLTQFCVTRERVFVWKCETKTFQYFLR
jgi:hypothetical protein